MTCRPYPSPLLNESSVSFLSLCLCVRVRVCVRVCACFYPIEPLSRYEKVAPLRALLKGPTRAFWKYSDFLVTVPGGAPEAYQVVFLVFVSTTLAWPDSLSL